MLEMKKPRVIGFEGEASAQSGGYGLWCPLYGSVQKEWKPGGKPIGWGSQGLTPRTASFLAFYNQYKL